MKKNNKTMTYVAEYDTARSLVKWYAKGSESSMTEHSTYFFGNTMREVSELVKRETGATLHWDVVVK